MTTARIIIGGALSFWLNRLSPGETLDADLGAMCLAALNDVVDEIDGAESLLFQEVLTPGVCTGVSGTLGTTWPGLSSGNDIHGATVSYQVGMDIPLEPLTMQQYQEIAQKATASIPRYYAHDGATTVYLWPAAAGQTITLLTMQSVSVFADLDTNYLMPSGFQAGLSVMVAERMAVTLNPGALPKVEVAARAARNRLAAQTSNPSIVDSAQSRSGNILSGWR